MELKNAKCPNCGATIKVNPGAKTAICMYCQSEYEVEEGINQYNIAHQDVKEQSISGNVSVGTQVIQHQTVINNVSRPRKFLTVAKATDVTVYKELRYDLIDRRQVDNGTKYEYVLEREDSFSNDRELMSIECQIDTKCQELSNQCQKEVQNNSAKSASIVGLVFLFFIPAIGWFILFVVAISALIAKSSTKSSIKKNKARLVSEINSLKEKWIETALRKGLLD